jgi:hypothetical protein
MVIEGIITTENPDGSPHLAPIGPHVDEALTRWELKPFQTSTTFSNLRRTNRGVFHVVDDALLMANAVLGRCRHAKELLPLSDSFRASFENEHGWVLVDACRVFGLEILRWDVSQPRANAECRLTLNRELRAFWGWNRAAHSVLELCILASRLHLLPHDEVQRERERHQIIIEKTAGQRERAAWELLNRHLSQ